MKKLLAMIFIPILFVTACTTSNSSAARVSAPEFLDQISAAGVVLIDVRTPEEFTAGHLPNALNINVESADFESQVAALDKNTTYGVYCRSGNRSSVASDKMSELGFTSLINSSAGLDELVANGATAVTK
jgi:rhodanese-related sulfurtransferase